MEELIYPVLVFGAGFLSGIINVMAGGGSVITLGVLILLGMDPTVANGTNRIGLVVETGSGVLAFKSENYSEAKKSLSFALLTIPGALLGAFYAVKINDLWSHHLVGPSTFLCFYGTRIEVANIAYFFYVNITMFVFCIIMVSLIKHKHYRKSTTHFGSTKLGLQ